MDGISIFDVPLEIRAPKKGLESTDEGLPWETTPIEVRPESRARMQQRQRAFFSLPSAVRFWRPYNRACCNKTTHLG
jgi:hypothetical protein